MTSTQSTPPRKHSLRKAPLFTLFPPSKYTMAAVKASLLAPGQAHDAKKGVTIIIKGFPCKVTALLSLVAAAIAEHPSSFSRFFLLLFFRSLM